MDNFDDMASAVGLFIAQCGEMAETNWCESQVEMLHRLFTAVLIGKDYASDEVTKEMNIRMEERNNETV